MGRLAVAGVILTKSIWTTTETMNGPGLWFGPGFQPGMVAQTKKQLRFERLFHLVLIFLNNTNRGPQQARSKKKQNADAKRRRRENSTNKACSQTPNEMNDCEV